MKKNLQTSSMAEPCPIVLLLKEKVAVGRKRSGLLPILLLLSSVAFAQTTLSIGDKLPENITVKNVRSPLSSGRGAGGEGELNLSSLKGKLIIIDFWATWCAPCIAMLPKTDSLQKVFQKNVQFLPVTYESREKVEKLLSKSKKLSGITLPMATNEQTLHSLFPHKQLPHYVWINSEGTVTAITGSQEVSADNIRAMLSGDKPQLTEKKDVLVNYDRDQPLLFADLGITKDKLHFESLMGEYVPGLSGRYDIIPNPAGGIQRITAINASLEMLYLLAWSNGKQYISRNRVVYEVKDSVPLITSGKDKALLKNWMQKYTRCYELILPTDWSTKAFEIMQRDLSFFFPQYKVVMEKRKVPCLALIRTSDKDNIKTKGNPSTFSFAHFEASMTNCSLDLLVAQLSAIYLQNLPTPIVNSTGYTSNVDLFIDANLTNVESLRKALQPYGLDLVNKDQEIEVLVIRDSN